MSFAPLYVGRLQLAERPGGVMEDVSHSITLVRSVTFEGQESMPPLDAAELSARAHGILDLIRTVVPIRFSEKTDRDGFYEIVDNNTALRTWGGEVTAVNWQIRANRIGSDTQVDLESQLSGAQTRRNEHGLVGERWHAPPPLAYAYQVPTGAPSTLTVTGAEGPLTVYRDLPVGVNPKWGCPIDGYGGYRVRFIDADNLERSGFPPHLVPVGWELHNSLVRVRVSADGLLVAVHDGAGWAEKTWQLSVADGVLGAPMQCAVIRNDYEAGTVRLVWPRPVGPGRVQLDVTIRRGARWVEGHLQTRPGGATLAVGLATPETTTAGVGYITATNDDADGHRFVLGAADAFTADTGASSIEVVSAQALHFMVGAVVGGGSAPAGDQAADHVARYLGSTAENVRAVRR